MLAPPACAPPWSRAPVPSRPHLVLVPDRSERTLPSSRPAPPPAGDADTPPSDGMVTRRRRYRIELQFALDYTVGDGGADFALQVHASHTARQRVVAESLILEPATTTHLRSDPVTGNRCLQLRAGPGLFQLVYQATVDLDPLRADPRHIAEVPVGRLPADVMVYLLPSRYCPSDRLVRWAHRSFGHLPSGYARVVAIRDWVRQWVTFAPGTSDAGTTAIDTLVDTVGVCRDFAHLMIALCRALNLPARFTTGTDFGADPALGPPDFHAYVEVYLADAWYIFDPSGTAIPMGLVRLGTGRDAADVPVAMIFGRAIAAPPVLLTRAIVDDARGLLQPQHCDDGLSTDDEPRSSG
jgi:transglutaminase-like putative cysteine protease